MTKTKNTKKKVDKTKATETAEKKQEQVQTQNDVKIESKQDNTPKERQVRQQLDENMLVRIASGVQGGLTYISRDGSIVLRFEQYGDEDVIELKYLRRMLSQDRHFLQRGWIRVLDEDVVEYLRLDRFQSEVVTPEDLEDLLKMNPEDIRTTIQKSNTNTKSLIYNYAKTKYLNGELTNVHVIEAIEDELGLSLNPNK